MSHPLCLAHLTVLELSPPEVIETAAAAGFEQVGLRLAPALQGQYVFPMLNQAPLMRETLARMRDLNIKVNDVEIIGLHAQSCAQDYLSFFEAAAQLGARYVLVAGDSTDESALAQRLAEFSQLALPFGLRMGLEFMPWRGVNSLASAKRVLQAAGPGPGLIVDAIHWDRAQETLASMRTIAPEQWCYFQICDAPAKRPASMEGIMFQAREARLIPGEGGLNLTAMLQSLPAGVPISIEAPLQDPRSPLEKATALRVATQRLIAQAELA
ncbi:sugar phosphate isomerase/epimerase [Lampropedia puyangensis]|uniref:Sugar phosphate isomerase/epimerase n=1 Tax=Lampropedia puyangensis TaxID=1330072 RepID=A0A4S8EVJ3_9BURK|nr:TIM barrel protein [Lampropedia puyangensis]THT98478.1 sugar phosphate isomerase/epimerase [Lampropedia puyangensis]